MNALEEFRHETRAWLSSNCPAAARGPGQILTGSTKIKPEHPDIQLWLERMAERGWTAPMWPKAYGGGGLSRDQYAVLLDEMRAIGARTPLMGMGTSMIGPTLLELGTEDQKRRHLPPIIRGELAWCQGYSEPSAGSDLASLRTRAEDRGDHFVINGQKIWTSGAQWADWMFALVRTNPMCPSTKASVSYCCRWISLESRSNPSSSSAAHHRSAKRSSTTPSPRKKTSSARSTRGGQSASACCSTNA
ncbi:MAG: hypothetical protein HC809_13130, partial [Gammaproteobacteria bacterium]|nr:hypothetical protein [Gammaproteobacteria bacterium]